MSKEKLVKVQFKGEHTVNGTVHAPGQIFEMSEASAQTFIKAGNAELYVEQAAAPTKQGK